MSKRPKKCPERGLGRSLPPCTPDVCEHLPQADSGHRNGRGEAANALLCQVPHIPCAELKPTPIAQLHRDTGRGALRVAHLTSIKGVAAPGRDRPAVADVVFRNESGA
jgi:hypothetical protein